MELKESTCLTSKQQSFRIYDGEKTISLTSDAGKTGQTFVKE